MDKNTYQTTKQTSGSNAHSAIDTQHYSDRKNILQGINVYCEEFNILGKIDTFDIETGILTERKNKIVKIYDGYIFQLYAQYYALKEMRYNVKQIRFHSIKDNKNYDIDLPENNPEMDKKFRDLIVAIKKFDIHTYQAQNIEKCKNCIYEPSCDRSLIC
jgi:CRISPR-associated protein Cas4